jgi:DNA-directed RNA polymerase specialized sigma24 family protein
MNERLNELYEAHVSDVYGYLAYRLGSRAEAEHLTRLTFERASHEPESSDPARIWLLKIARQLTRGRSADPWSDDLGLEPELARALAGLDRGPRSVIALRFGAGLRGPEIAGVLGVSQAEVRRLLSQGIRRVRSELARAKSAAESNPGRGDQEQQRP